ncbi:hypothetical protein BV98_003806 [Sphingobium herbicidovorans NBRC 16415]|uniref:Uncharacterized protein n=1 Tax=Sphingobium herbicidovorans (strain ATCC 700291 / DSM 11019 / CCUG 56400 / KCTC 2939 / LMG 18315 / NBRC 16415 / MH) TaxID=1219045 RepID=A0A086P4T8_SPHHM|nr:hypothetical protein BV98_003806 [Sphingobium herbicidovorans NBRC 16415]
MSETISEYHRRRASEEMAEAAIHCDDITAEQHRRLARQHLALAREAEKLERNGPGKGERAPSRPAETGL